MAGPLGVTHLLLFSRSATGNVHLRIALAPRGPTLHFRVSAYSLCKDVRQAQRRPQGGGREYLNAPLLVMNNFQTPESSASEKNDGPSSSQTAVPKHLESLTTNVFQSLFPAIAPQTTPLSAIQRVLLLNRELPRKGSAPGTPAEDAAFAINFRHYAITTRRTGLSRAVRRINAAERRLREGSRKPGHDVPDLGQLDDVADYMLDPDAAATGFTSGSEVETDAEVEVLETATRKVLNKKKLAAQRRSEDGEGRERKGPGHRVEKRAVKLVELGPRMKLRLIKVEEGVCAGKVMWHEFVTKSKEEVKAMDKSWEEKRRVKEERRRVQRENLERKRREREAGKEGAGNEEDNGDEEDWDSEDDEMEDLDYQNGETAGDGSR